MTSVPPGIPAGDLGLRKDKFSDRCDRGRSGTTATVGLGKADQARSRGSATPTPPGLSLLHFHVIGCFRPLAGCRFGLGIALCPRGALAAGVELCALLVDPARGLVRAGLQFV
jgi:hypothetical protein